MSRWNVRPITWTIVSLALVLSWTAPSQAQDTGKRIGERLDEVGRDIRGEFNRAGNAAKEQFNRAKGSVQNMGIEGRVYSRLHWDKALHDATIDLAVDGEGVVTMTGSVATAAAKTKAVELARDTVGVTKVVDSLAVKAPTRVTTPAASR